MVWIVFSQNLYVEILSVTGIQYRAFKDVTKVKWAHKGVAQIW